MQKLKKMQKGDQRKLLNFFVISQQEFASDKNKRYIRAQHTKLSLYVSSQAILGEHPIIQLYLISL